MFKDFYKAYAPVAKKTVMATDFDVDDILNTLYFKDLLMKEDKWNKRHGISLNDLKEAKAVAHGATEINENAVVIINVERLLTDLVSLLSRGRFCQFCIQGVDDMAWRTGADGYLDFYMTESDIIRYLEKRGENTTDYGYILKDVEELDEVFKRDGSIDMNFDRLDRLDDEYRWEREEKKTIVDYRTIQVPFKNLGDKYKWVEYDEKYKDGVFEAKLWYWSTIGFMSYLYDIFKKDEVMTVAKLKALMELLDGQYINMKDSINLLSYKRVLSQFADRIFRMTDKPQDIMTDVKNISCLWHYFGEKGLGHIEKYSFEGGVLKYD